MKRTISIVLSALMVLACCTALFTLSVSAAAPGFDWVDEWVHVDGTATGTWQTNTVPSGDDVFTFDYACIAKNGVVNIGVKINAELTGTTSAYGNGQGTNVRIWFHDPNNTTFANWQYLLDVSWRGTYFDSNLRGNGTGTVVAYGDGTTPSDPGAHYTLNTSVTATGADVEVMIPVSEVSASSDVQVVICVSNNRGTNYCLYHGCAYATYSPWDARPDACLYPTKPGFNLGNVAEGCSYTIPTNGNNTYQPTSDNGVYLTDGNRAAGASGSTYRADCDTEVIVDLGSVMRVWGGAVYSNDGQWGVWVRRTASIAYSTDGTNFTALTNNTNARMFSNDFGTVGGWTQNIVEVFPSVKIEARYVKFIIPKGNYVWCDEVEVYAEKAPELLVPGLLGSYDGANVCTFIPWTVADSMQELVDAGFCTADHAGWAYWGIFAWDSTLNCYVVQQVRTDLGASKSDVVIPEYGFLFLCFAWYSPNPEYVTTMEHLTVGQKIFVYGEKMDKYTRSDWGSAVSGITISTSRLDESVYGEKYIPVEMDGDIDEPLWYGNAWTEIAAKEGSYMSIPGDRIDADDFAEHLYGFRYSMKAVGEYLYVCVRADTANATQLRLWLRTSESELYTHFIDVIKAGGGGLKTNTSTTTNAAGNYTAVDKYSVSDSTVTSFEFRVKLADVGLTGVPTEDQFFIAITGVQTHYYPAISSGYARIYSGADTWNGYYPWNSWYTPNELTVSVPEIAGLTYSVTDTSATVAAPRNADGNYRIIHDRNYKVNVTLPAGYVGYATDGRNVYDLDNVTFAGTSSKNITVSVMLAASEGAIQFLRPNGKVFNTVSTTGNYDLTGVAGQTVPGYTFIGWRENVDDEEVLDSVDVAAGSIVKLYPVYKIITAEEAAPGTVTFTATVHDSKVAGGVNTETFVYGSNAHFFPHQNYEGEADPDFRYWAMKDGNDAWQIISNSARFYMPIVQNVELWVVYSTDTALYEEVEATVSDNGLANTVITGVRSYYNGTKSAIDVVASRTVDETYIRIVEAGIIRTTSATIGGSANLFNLENKDAAIKRSVASGTANNTCYALTFTNSNAGLNYYVRSYIIVEFVAPHGTVAVAGTQRIIYSDIVQVATVGA